MPNHNLIRYRTTYINHQLSVSTVSFQSKSVVEWSFGIIPCETGLLVQHEAHAGEGVTSMTEEGRHTTLVTKGCQN